MRILMVASEAFPFFKTGGLGDVTGALSQTLARNPKNEVVLFLPRYRDMNCPEELMPKPAQGKIFVPISGGIEEASLEYVKWGNVSTFFINSKRFFDRPG
ncbi:MAG: glycogen/starch synthase, partial [Elusimicrobiales bacterium]|nr:glycogen/starch synthase [Elusimicrobiales bacterium]